MIIEWLLLLLNFVLVLGGIAVQLPQIYKLASTKNVAGLSEASWTIQTFSTGFYCAYNYLMDIPFMTWGDAFFADVEYCIIVGLIWFYGIPHDQLSDLVSNMRKFTLFCFFTVLILTITKKSPYWFTTLMGISPMPMVVAGRVPQILVNYQNKSAGQLSLPSLVMQCGGNFARIISTLILVPDSIVLLSHATAFIFNLIPLLQLVYYDLLKRDLSNWSRLLKTNGSVYISTQKKTEQAVRPEILAADVNALKKRQTRL